jgi:hypothetical protein
VAAAAVTGAWLAVAAESGYLTRATIVAAVVATVVLAGGLVLRQALAVPIAVCLLGAPYVARLGFEADALDTRAPLIAALLLAVAELGYWSLELRGTIADEPGTYLRRIALLAALFVGTIVAGTGILALVAVVATRGIAVDVVGVVAAAGAMALLVLAARRGLG